ncbi:translation initiation factor IF-2-like [Vulpes lagopus]|uniref:translation initiation factor IF-2-like n=1 Tax=Vulpes lagopus TaxID=494514 RepID=UPI001BC98653|nr:translation initiation factor IF-2-like [Vulpes lagopus]
MGKRLYNLYSVQFGEEGKKLLTVELEKVHPRRSPLLPVERQLLCSSKRLVSCKLSHGHARKSTRVRGRGRSRSPWTRAPAAARPALPPPPAGPAEPAHRRRRARPHTCRPGKGQSRAEVLPDAAAQRPAHWPSIRPSPSPAASRGNPEGILPRPFAPRSQSRGGPNSSGLAAEARGLGRSPGAGEEAAAGAGGLRGAGRRPEQRGAFPRMTPLTGEQRLLIPTCDLRGPVFQAWRKLKPQPATWHRNVQLVPFWGSCDRDPAINIRGASDQDRIRAPGEQGKEALCGYFVTKATPQVYVK